MLKVGEVKEYKFVYSRIVVTAKVECIAEGRVTTAVEFDGDEWTDMEQAIDLVLRRARDIKEYVKNNNDKELELESKLLFLVHKNETRKLYNA